MGLYPIWNEGNIDIAALQEILPYVSAAIALWFSNMAVTGWLAGRRGRDDGLWAVIAFLLGPIALVAVLILPPRPRPDAFEGLPVVPPTYTGEWPELPPPTPPINPAERLLGALLGAGVGAAGTGVLVAVSAIQPPEVPLLVGSASGAIVGYVVSSSLIEANRNKLVGVGIGAGVLALSVAGLLIAVARGLLAILNGSLGLEAIPLVLLVGVAYPLIFALFAQGVLAVAIIGAAIWATATHLLLSRGTVQSAQSASPSAG